MNNIETNNAPIIGDTNLTTVADVMVTSVSSVDVTPVSDTVVTNVSPAEITLVPRVASVDVGVDLRCDTLKDFLNSKIPEREDLLSPWLPKQGLALVFAPRGVGKTFFALNVAYAVASGTEYLGWQADKAHKVLYLDGEMAQSDMQSRLSEIATSNPSDNALKNMQLMTPDRQGHVGMPNLATEKGQEEVSRFAENVDLVVVDNIASLCGGIDENASAEWQFVQEWAKQMKRLGKTVLFVHHSGKSGQQRGSSAREDILDTVISLNHPKNYVAGDGARFRIVFTKNRGFYGDDALPIEAKLVSNDSGIQWVTSRSFESNEEHVIELINQGKSQVDIVKELGIDKSTVSRCAKKGREKGLISNNAD